MKIRTLLSTTALIATLAIAPLYAQQSPQHAGARNVSANQQPPRARGQQALNQLPPEKAKLFRDAQQQIRVKNKPLREQLTKAQAEQVVIISADKFDEKAYLAKNAEIEKIFSQIRANSAVGISAVAVQLTPVERRQIVKQLQLRHR